MDGCYADATGEETPRRLMFDDHALDVAEATDRRLAAGHRYFKVRTVDGAIFVLRHDAPSQRWELVMVEAPAKLQRAHDASSNGH
jgi:adenosine/AMP kinase